MYKATTVDVRVVFLSPRLLRGIMDSQSTRVNGGVFHFPMNVNSDHWVLATLDLEALDGRREVRLRDPLGTNKGTYSHASPIRKGGTILSE